MSTQINTNAKLKNPDQLVNDPIVLKRDGRQQSFDPDKFFYSYQKLCHSQDQPCKSKQEFFDLSLNQVVDSGDMQVVKAEELNQLMDQYLADNEPAKLLKAHRQYNQKKKQHFKNQRDINVRIQSLLQQDRSVVNENANKDSRVFNTQRDLTAGIVAKAMGLKLLPDHVANAHEKGDIHYHDLDYSPYSTMTNCCLIDFKSMFEQGFYIGNAEVESPRSIQTATAQTAQIIANVASSQYGGCTFDRVDEVLAPYAEINYKKHLKIAEKWLPSQEDQKAFAKERTKKDIYDAMQSLEYEINTLYTSQGQTPFTSLGFGLGESWYEREIQKAILKVRIQGLGKEKRTAIFPKLIFTIKEGLNRNPADKNYDIKQLALECSTKRMYPDILNYDKMVELTGSFKAPMGCRSFLPAYQDEKGEQVSAGRMNLGVITLNLPRIAIEAKGSVDRFWQILDERLEVLYDGLIFKVGRVMESTPENAPILYQYGAFGKRVGPQGDVRDFFYNRRATVSLGYIGLYEVAQELFGEGWEFRKEDKKFTLDILAYLKQTADEWSDKHDLHFSVYATPSESLTDRFCQLDREKFGCIKDVTDKDYYTNSFHYDIRKSPSPFDKLDFEKDYPKYSSGGFIHYCEYPKLTTNPKALEAVWDYAYDRVGYLGTNTPIDKCYKCQYEGEFNPTEHGFECPSCKNTDPDTCDVVKRTCGYLGNPQKRPMVHGRHQEISARVKHMKVEGDNNDS